MVSRAARWSLSALAIGWLVGAGSVAQAIPVTYSLTGSFTFASGIGATPAPVALQGGSFTLDLNPAAGSGSFVSGSLDFGSFDFINTLSFFFFTFTSTTTASGVVHGLSAGGPGVLDPLARTLSFTGASQLSGAPPSGSESCVGSGLACAFAPTALNAANPFDAVLSFAPGYASFTLNASFTDGAGGTTSLAVSGAPEPASHLLMAVGIAGLALFGRRRSR